MNEAPTTNELPTINHSDAANLADKIPEDESQMPKGKLKKLFRQFHTSMTTEITRRLDHINGQVKGIETTLDKKYGGMYKVLIGQFLTKQDSKIYNLEILGLAVKEVLSEHLYSVADRTDTYEEYSAVFAKNFDAKLLEVKDRIDASYKKATEEKENVEQKQETKEPDLPKTSGQKPTETNDSNPG